MARWFNTAGPCNPANHYMLPALRRLPEVQRLIDQQGYFVVHAPRQVGKTTALLSLAQELTSEGRYVAALVSMEVGAGFPQDIGAAEAAILQSWRGAMRAQLPTELQPPPFPEAPPGSRIATALASWSETARKPVVVFLDEIDALRDDVLISVLRQLRDGYRNRPGHFPSSLALIGLRDVRDYKVTSSGSDHLASSSPFNIKVRSLTMRDFTEEEVAELYAQHTADTGQRFEPEALALAFALTQGQPWLVNALAKVTVEELVTDTAQPVRRADIERAKAILIQRQETHLDSLAERLREPRIRAILEPMLAGELLGDVPEDDRRFAIDLGLLRRNPEGTLEVANPIYREVIVGFLASGTRATLPSIQPSWLKPDGRLDTERLRDAFLAFWRQHGEPLLATAPYHEIAPHLVLMAFLHRVVNGGGSIEREYAIGRGRMDLCVRHGPDTLAIEIKVWRDREPDPLPEGLTQLDGYLQGLGQRGGWLVLFDRRSGQPPIAERTRAEEARTPSGLPVTVIRA
ncbi:ATP-binding protein [Pyxidicoccus fallax]|uniref:ATP-binding protein n=1 Tax=Pyxidicoccus fallax TaxID=394095 RepID=A0A848LP99_9BACT|nr:ATP-binding protein [Pyxidicoccus fallax]NMO19698.1 ATP-binding protein [Pyxidicoccus fallax]NPC81257.1 ATP-binding protein [Pyxidicoccus fallax]